MKRIALALLLTTPCLAQTLEFPTRPADRVFAFYSEGSKMVFTIHSNGSVEFGEGFTADDATKIFWENLATQFPNKCEDTK